MDTRSENSSTFFPYGKTLLNYHGKFMNDVTFPHVSALVLAGGQSRRMGCNKAFLDFKGTPLIARVIDCVQRVCAETIIVANDPETFACFGLRVVRDVYPGKGSLGGIYSGLQSVSAEYALVVACDLPFVNEALLRYMIGLTPDTDVVIPRSHAPTGKARDAASYNQLAVKESGLQATQALYSKNCLEPMRARLFADDLCIINFFDEVRVRVVEPHEVARFDPQKLSFVNVNSPVDLAMALSMVNTTC